MYDDTKQKISSTSAQGALLPNKIADEYWQQGYAAPIDVLSVEEVAYYRQALEQAEERLGSLHYHQNIQTLLHSAYKAATHPRLLDAVEAIIGPDIRLYAATYIIKEPHTSTFVSWHQDLTYWGLEGSDQVVSGWLALAPATPENGCMKMIKGSHKFGQQTHRHTQNQDNVLFMGQTVEHLGVDDGDFCTLGAGQLSLHHGWMLHSSMSNNSDTRRIGLNVQFVNPAVKPKHKMRIPTLLVRGEDKYGYFDDEIPASGEADEASLLRHKKYNRIMTQAFQEY